MTTAQPNWQHPDWIYLVQKKLGHIDLSKFPSFIMLDHHIIHPDKNKYLPQWAICIDVKMEIKDRVNGYRTTLVNPEGVYLYSEKNFEQIIYVEIERLLVHELKECFQIRENAKAVIPFDPHDTKRARIKLSTYDKVDFYRHYPSWMTSLKLSINKMIDKMRTNSFSSMIEKIQSFSYFIETKVLEEGPKAQQEKVTLFYKP